MGRVELHRESLNPLLERFVARAPRILDVGCGTGATTVAMALSDVTVIGNALLLRRKKID